MARYSFAVYGTPGLKYGQLENNRAYYNANLKALSFVYKTVSLYWTSVLTDPLDDPPTHWKVVRNYQGASDNPNDGTIVDSGTIASYRVSAVDQNVDVDTEITYSFWLFNGTSWINCGNSTVTPVEESETPTLRKMQNWVPAVWLDSYLNSGDGIGEPENNDLTKVLSAYAFAYDNLRAEANMLEKSSEYLYTPIALLKNKVEERGFTYEPTLGDIYHRGVYRVSELVNTKKGTTEAVISYTTALTHWASKVEVGKNLMLDYNDSSFEESIGRWSAGSGTLVHNHYANSVTDFGVAIVPPTVTYDNPNPYFSPRVVGLMSLTGDAGATNVLSLPATSANKIVYGIPIKKSTRYRFKGYARVVSSSNDGSVKAKIYWYDKTGAEISSTSYGSTVSLTQSFKEFVSPSDNTEDGIQSPSNAVYASIEISAVTTSASTTILFDMFEFVVAPNTSYYEDARKIKVYVEGEKTNYIPNPSFEAGTSGWGSINGTLTNTSSPAASIFRGTKVAEVTSTGSGVFGIYSDWITIDSSQNYTFSAYVSSNTTKNIKARLEFSALQSAEEQSIILDDVDGKYYPERNYYIDSDPLTLSSTLQRISVTSVSPDTTVDSGQPSVKLWLYLEDAVAGDIIYVDAALLEDGVEATTFFDGDGAPAPANPLEDEYIVSADCMWEDATTSSGKSNRLTNYTTKLIRLTETLPLVMPYGSSWEVKPGFPTKPYPELNPSVLPAPSFEHSTEGWVTDSSTLTREVDLGSLFNTYATHGVAYGKITSTASTAFGVHSEKYPIDYAAGYYVSAAIKPQDSDAFGSYSLKVRFYDSSNALLLQKMTTVTINHSDRWAYVAAYTPKYEISGAAYAQVYVEATPDSLGSGRVFLLDRVVFRQ